MRKRAALRLLTLPFACAALPARVAAASAPVWADASGLKVLRYAFRIAETGFDPVQVTDLYSRNILANVFDTPYRFGFLARPVRMVPNTAAGLPEVSDDFKTFTVRIKPGVFFTDHPAFKGARRELTATDHLYTIKRHFDPRWKSGHLSSLENHQILGMDALRRDALAGKPFDYDREVEGLRAIDRYTIRFTLAAASPRFAEAVLTDVSMGAAMAREVVEADPDHIMEHPVGTGAFRLAEWRRSSRIVLERNPGYRDEFYDEDAPADDPLAQATVAKLKGRKLPMVDRVEIGIIEESQPRWLSFTTGEMDLIEFVPPDFSNVAIPNNKLAPNLAKRGISMIRYQRNDIHATYFAMENPLVGGYTPAKVALRRAIALAADVPSEIRNVRRGQAIVANAPVSPHVYGYDAAFRSEMGDFNRARAQALLDLHGYVDRNGDGWREQPDGQPLLLEFATQPDDEARQLITEWQKNMSAVGLRIDFKTAKWPENLKASRAGKLMMWMVGWTSAGIDASDFLILGYGPAKGQNNHARFDLPAYNALYDRQQGLPDGAERLAVMDQMKRILVAYMPYKAHVHRVWTDMAQPWVVGFHRNVFVRDWWRLVDIDNAERARRAV